jgi:hypothetical protein
VVKERVDKHCGEKSKGTQHPDYSFAADIIANAKQAIKELHLLEALEVGSMLLLDWQRNTR